MKSIQGSELREKAKAFHAKLIKIKVCAFDVDGVLTDGRVFYQGEEVGFNRFAHVHDGYGLKLLQKSGFKVGVISGGKSLSVIKRYQDNLNLDFSYLGNEDKREAYLKLLESGHRDEEILYMADEFFDLPLLKRAGFSATVPEASIEIQEAVDYVSFRSGGHGAVREVIDMLRFVHGIVPQVEDFE